MKTIVFSQEAQKDLKAIRHYTRAKWGDAKADQYTARLRDAVYNLHELNAKPFARIDPFMYRVRCEKHYIWFLNEKDKMVILAILHEKMDMLSRMKDRLTDD